MSSQRHVILKETFEITLATSEEAWPLQEQISHIAAASLRPLIERVCDGLSTPDCLHRIERLELDLGRLAPHSLSKELPTRFESAFRRALAQAVKQQDTSGLPAMTTSQLELFVQFFQQGTLPWWADLEQSGQPEGSVDYLLQQAPELLRQVLPPLAAETLALRRLISHLEDRRLADLAVLQAPALGDFPLALFQGTLVAAANIPHLASVPQTRIRAHLWQSLLQHILLPESAPADRTDFARGVLLCLARLLTISYPILLEGLSKASEDLQGPVREITGALAREFQAPSNPASLGKNVREGQIIERNLTVLGKEEAANPNLSQNMEYSPSFRQGMPESSHREAKLQPSGGWLKQIGYPADLSGIPSQNDDIFANMRIADEEGIILGNAGLVILWPFLDRLFERLGLAEDQKITNESSRQRGLAVLHYLATGDASPPPEYLLPLNKRLCGMQQEAVFDLDSPLTEAETGACDDFLTAVIAQAPILHDMPIAGLRGNFLLRAGMLQVKYGLWLLRVERETHDVVLDHFPWGFQWVSLPWMEGPLQVEW